MTQSLAGKTIFVAEDCWFAADDMRIAIEAAGGTVVGPFATPEAARAGSASRIDAAIVDIHLRGGTAYPIMDELMRRDVLVVIVSGYAQSALPERFAETLFFDKPCNLRRLMHLVSTRAAPT